MTRLRRTVLAACVGASLFVLNVWLPAQVAGHAAHHSHHSSATHADPLCTLLCSAGHAAHAGVLVVWQHAVPVEVVESGHNRRPATRPPTVPFPRGPPAPPQPFPSIQV